jgi:hypothetical protein
MSCFYPDAQQPTKHPPMTFQQEIDAFKLRIAQAEARRDGWRAAGDREKYLEAYFMVEAMELLLDERLRRHAAEQPAL